MNSRLARQYTAGFAIATALLALLFVALNAGAQTPAGDCIQLHVNGALVYESDACNAPEPTATPAPTDTPDPPDEPIEPYPDAPPCPSHDDRAWHGLWDGERGCFFPHHHGDDPHAVDDIFGTAYYDRAGGSISYPWQTFSDAGTENELKHEGYIWQVRRDLPCHMARGLRAFRVQMHQMASGHGAVTRYHSFAAEVETCEGGVLRLPGWQDFGNLIVDGEVVIDEPNSGNRERQHRSDNPGTVWYGSSLTEFEGRQGLFRGSLTIYDNWDYTSASDPGATDDYVCYPNPRCTANGTNMIPHLIVVDVPREFEPIVDPDGDRIADYQGYVNRWGQIVTGCEPGTLDCLWFSVENLRIDIQYRADARDNGPPRDYDVYFGGQTAGWAQPPGTGD